METRGAEGDPDRSTKSSGLTIPWSGISLGLLVTAVTAVGVLVVVVSIQEVDTLSTVALALAVLAFSAQLIVTLAQAQQASQLSAETKGALTEMRATTASLLTNQRDQFDRVLRFALEKAIPAAVEDVTEVDRPGESETDSEERPDRNRELKRALIDRLSEQFGTSRISLSEPYSYAPVIDETENPRGAIKALLRTYPSRQEGEAVMQIVRELPPRPLSWFNKLIRDLGARGEADFSVRYRRTEGKGTPAGTQRLIDAGLIEVKTEPPLEEGGYVHYRLTPAGITAARLLVGQGDPPEWATGLA